MAYNYDTPTTPQPANFRRVTTQAFFTRDGDTLSGDIRLGNITMSALKHGNSEVDVMRAHKGGLQRAAMATTEVKPEYEITIDEYTPDLVAVSLFGKLGTDTVQASAANATLNLASVNVGRSYHIGRLGLTSVSVTAGGVAKQRDLDYQLDEDIGRITIMDGGGIADGAAVVVTYSCAALTRKTVLPYTVLNVYGFMRLYEEDAIDRTPRAEISFRCHLAPSAFGDGNPKAYSESKFKASVLGAMTRRER